MIGVYSKGILRIPHLADFLGSPVVPRTLGRFRQPVTAVAGWGLRPTARRAREYAERHALPYIALEDGFLRSVGLGSHDAPLSLVVDDLGIYYDATRPSRLEALVSRSLADREVAAARALVSAWRAGRVSKYNCLREYAGTLPTRYVLVVDQTLGDASIRYGLAAAESFRVSLRAALEEYPDCTVLLKTHPDVFAGRKRGHFDLSALARLPRVEVLAEDVHPVRLIEHAEALYVVTSQMGFEGLLWGRPVRTFGMPFYAGWGLSEDELPAPARRGRSSLEQLVHAALLAYPRYVDPETGERCGAETVLAHLALQRRMRARFPAQVYALGFSPYKKPIVRRYFWGSKLRFVRRAESVPAGATLAVWGRRGADPTEDGRRVDGLASPPRLPPDARQRWQLVRLEDGFLRSVGLGADLVRPLSWVMDTRGIYYDATAPSDLEHLLQTVDLYADVLTRARALRQRIVAEGLTKYNVGTGGWRRPPGTQRVVLVPGQVEVDASITFGSPGIRSNMGLLRAVREANPDAHVVYKPHPDVLAGLRASGAGEGEAAAWCDEQVTRTGMAELLAQVDEVHVLTSLAGFEALLRGKPVTCYGQPFYAGWGLTRDIEPLSRRARRLSLDELVAAALILYPTYVSRTTGRFTTPERALQELLAWRDREAPHLPLWRRLLRLGLRVLVRTP